MTNVVSSAFHAKS
jgi:hypothetical protein